MHQISNYHYWLIYNFQNPSNFDSPYFSYENYVEEHPADLQSESTDETYEGSSSPPVDSE